MDGCPPWSAAANNVCILSSVNATRIGCLLLWCSWRWANSTCVPLTWSPSLEVAVTRKPARIVIITSECICILWALFFPSSLGTKQQGLKAAVFCGLRHCDATLYITMIGSCPIDPFSHYVFDHELFPASRVSTDQTSLQQLDTVLVCHPAGVQDLVECQLKVCGESSFENDSLLTPSSKK